MPPVLSIQNVSKTYAGGVTALSAVDLDIREGEIFALLGPNGAGKTTLISICCGLVTASSGTVTVAGHDHVRDWRAARAAIGLVPQELHVDMFEKVGDALALSRGLFGLKRDPAKVEAVLKSLSLWDKKDEKINALSGGMKRRVMIAKALVHEPRILFLDEPTAGVDVELRRDMWAVVSELRAQGVTIILTTHYIEEAEELADRVGVIRKGALIVVEEKAALMRKLGAKRLIVELKAQAKALPDRVAAFQPQVEADGWRLVYGFDAHAEDSGVPRFLKALDEAGIEFRDLHTEENSLEDIFVRLIREGA